MPDKAHNAPKIMYLIYLSPKFTLSNAINVLSMLGDLLNTFFNLTRNMSKSMLIIAICHRPKNKYNGFYVEVSKYRSNNN